jgi:hypothetical protein
MNPKNFFVLDPVGELLYFEEELNKKVRSIENRAELISYYDENYSDLKEIIENLSPQYISALLDGLETRIKLDIKTKKIKYKKEIRMRQNKSLEYYNGKI